MDIAASYEHVVVVCIAVNYGAAQFWQQRTSAALKTSGAPVDQFSQSQAQDQRSVFANYPGPVGQVPVKIAMNSWMIKTCELPIQLAESLAEIAQQFRRMPPYFGERYAGQIGHQPHKVGDSR